MKTVEMTKTIRPGAFLRLAITEQAIAILTVVEFRRGYRPAPRSARLPQQIDAVNHDDPASDFDPCRTEGSESPRKGFGRNPEFAGQNSLPVRQAKGGLRC